MNLPLTVRGLLIETAEFFGLAVFLSGIACLVAIACFASERPHGCIAIGNAFQVGCTAP